MLAKLTAKNQLTLPKAATAAVGATEYFDVQMRGGAIVLTPVRIQRGDAVRAKLAELDLTTRDLDEAIGWSRTRVAETATNYGSKRAKRNATTHKATRSKAAQGKAGKRKS
jgi:hypothetical protein